MAEIYDNDVSAANNNSAPPAGYPENMQYSQVNDAAREQMAVLARYIEALSAITTTGAGNAYILTITQAIVALANGMHFTFKADKANTGAATLRINALGAVALIDNKGGALTAGDLVVGGVYLVEFDGVAFRLLGSAENAASIKTKYESNADTNAFDDAAQSKLTGIEAGASGDQTGAEIKTLYEAEADTNEFSDAEQTKLAGVEAGATGDQTGAEIKSLYEGEPDTNEFSDAEQARLAGIGDTRFKDATTPRASTIVLADDPDLANWALAGDVVYDFEAFLNFGALGTSGVLLRLLATGGVLGNESAAHYRLIDDNDALTERHTFVGEVLAFPTAALRSYVVRVSGTILTLFPGTFSLQWAQNVSSASGIELLRGSRICVRRLG